MAERYIPQIDQDRLSRREAVSALIANGKDDWLFVAGLAGTKNDVLNVTGKDAANVFAMGGAMGAAVSTGLGLALARPDKKVMVVTGDGELLMNVGTLSTVGIINPPNLGIICVDNEHYGETGFQKSHTALGVDLARIAEGSAIQSVRTVTQEGELDDAARMLREANGTSFVLLKVKPDYPPNVRGTWDASLAKNRFREALLGE